MRNRDASREQQKLNAIFASTNEACGQDLELLAHWARYLCVLSAGFLENSITHLFAEKAKAAASEHVANYVTASLSRSTRNPDMDKFVQVAKSFKPSWGTDLELFADENGRKEAVNSIMGQRHLIAHGKDSNISMARLNEYLRLSVEVLTYIENDLR